MKDALKTIPISIEYFQEVRYHPSFFIVDPLFIYLSFGPARQEMNVVPGNNERATVNWDENLSDMEKLMLMKCLKEEKLVFGVTAYVKKNMGQRFVESAMTSLPEM